MCLYNAKRVVHDGEDLVCYKVVSADMRSPYFPRKRWKIGKTESIKERMLPVVTNNGEIHDGAYHTYVNLKDAMNRVAYYPDRYVLECIIPHTSKYTYKGTVPSFFPNEDSVQNYASQKLKPIKILYQLTIPENLK